MGFSRLDSDPCVWRRISPIEITIALYVDDLILASKSEEALQPIKAALKAVFEMKDLGEAELILGIRMQRTEGLISLDQAHFIRDLVAQHQQENSKPVLIPVEGYATLEPAEDGEETTNQKSYREIIGSLN